MVSSSNGHSGAGVHDQQVKGFHVAHWCLVAAR